MTIRREDVYDLDFVDAVELASDESTSFLSGVTVVSTEASTKRVTISGASLNNPDYRIEAEDISVITGNAAAGTYHINSIISDTVFDVVEAILDSTGGSVAFRYPSGASRVGLNSTGFVNTSAVELQAALKDIDTAITSGGITESAHKTLRQLIHLADGGGPFEGFTSGAYRQTTGGIFPTAIVWYDSSGEGKKKIVEKLITWTGPNPTTIVWKAYDASETLLVTVTDTVTYSGVSETSRTRVIS